MKHRHFGVIAILAVSAVLFAGGLAKKFRLLGDSAGSRTVAVIPKGTASMWWEVVRRGAGDACDELGYEMIWTGPELETDREKQIAAVEDALAKHVVGIVISPNDSKALVRPIQKVKEAGVPCVIIDSGLETSEDDYVSFAATDNFNGGADAARRLAAELGGHGKVILTKFVQNSLSNELRGEGFKATLAKEFPGMILVDEQYTLGTVEDGRQRTEDMLLRNRNNVDGLFAVNQPMSVGAYKAIQSLNLGGKVKMVGFDSDPVLLEGIEKGEVSALIVQNPYQIGFQGVRLLADVLKGQSVPKKVPIPSMIVDAENLAEMKETFPAALGL